MTTAPSSAGLPLRQLQWPALPAVDLLEECPWLVNMDARKSNPERKTGNKEPPVRHKLDVLSEIDSKELPSHKSPYRQQLRRPKPPAPSPGSPAQRAAKSILKLKEGLLHLDNTKWSADTCVHDTQEAAVVLHQQTTSVRSTPKPIDSSVKTSTGTPSPNRVNTPVRSPSRKRKKRPLTREERELAQKQERLASWLKDNPDTDPTSVVEDADLIVDQPYSVEVEARIESAMQCRAPLESGVRLWDDPVRSLLAAEMTSESVFGGAVPTRALAFPSPERPSPSPPEPKDEEPLHEEENDSEVVSVNVTSPLSKHAQKVFGTAHQQVSDGSVADALATLEAGIRQSISTSQAHLDAVSGSQGEGFNYSALAHTNATKLQLYYRARHRRRIDRLVLLQRQWRWWHARRLALKSLQFANKQAVAIQRHYRSWHVHITQKRSAGRIQRCFRVFASQKILIRFRQLYRLLKARQARRLQVKTRIRMIGKVVLLFWRRRRRIALIQGLWRRRCAKAQLTALLAEVRASEDKRRAREDAFVAAKVDRALRHFKEFLQTTKRGRELVRWQMQKPWLRFRRMRESSRHWEELPPSERTEAVDRILHNRKFQGLHKRALCQMLVGMDGQLPVLPKVLKVSKEELVAFLTPLSTASSDSTKMLQPTCCPWWTGVREMMKQIQTMLTRRATTLWWATATYPKEYCTARVWPIRGRRQKQARQQLEEDFARVLTAFLRVWFRRIDQTNIPPYSCEWCSHPFSTCHEFFAHGKCATAREQAEQEQVALNLDLQFVRRKQWQFTKKPPDDPVQTVFDLEAASVRRLRRSRSHRKALRALVAMLEACTADETPNAVIPMDLAAFVLRYLDDSKSSHPLMQTAEHQLVRWEALVGTMQVGSSSLTPQSSGLDSRWIRKDDLRSRLIVGSNWRSTVSRWQRIIGRRAVKYRTLSAPPTEKTTTKNNCVAAKWKEFQLRMKRLIPRKRGSQTVQDATTAE